jgi:aminoglycoside phosphotransferase (APT) family kinase protein
MSTIGHPISDLINLTTPYYLQQAKLATSSIRSLPEFAPGATPGLPTQQQLVTWYGEVAGWDPSPELEWGIAFGFFRATCIYQGIAARWAVRQASSAKARDNAAARHPMAELAWEHVKKARDQSFMKERSKL